MSSPTVKAPGGAPVTSCLSDSARSASLCSRTRWVLRCVDLSKAALIHASSSERVLRYIISRDGTGASQRPGTASR
jgi:hypothetical protein